MSRGFEVLAIRIDHVERLSSLPRRHGDPFDRILVGNVTLYEYKVEDLLNVPKSFYEKHRHDGRAAMTNQYVKRIRYGNTAMGGVGNFLFELVFDCGEHDEEAPTPDDTTTTWPCRQDPFSTYRSRFDIRTYRLCRRVPRGSFGLFSSSTIQWCNGFTSERTTLKPFDKRCSFDNTQFPSRVADNGNSGSRIDAKCTRAETSTAHASVPFYAT